MAGRTRREAVQDPRPYLINLRACQTARFCRHALEHEVTRVQPLPLIKSRGWGEIRPFNHPHLQTHLRRRDQINGRDNGRQHVGDHERNEPS